MNTKKMWARLFIVMLTLSGCSSVKVQQIAKLGPKKLGVYAIAQNDFLGASRMLIVLNQKGDVAAYSGGTVSGPGTVGLQTAGTVATTGAAVYGAKAIEHGLENAQIKGIPSKVKVEGIPSDFTINGNLAPSNKTSK